MAKGDFKIMRSTSSPSVYRWQTEAGDADIFAGELVKKKAAGSPYVTPLVDADLTIGTDTSIIGLVKSDSTHTATEDGYIDIYIPESGMVYSGKASDPVNLADTIIGDRVNIDVVGGVMTIDENVGDGALNAFNIVGINTIDGTVEFVIRDSAVVTGE